jgi:acyl-coenzyme A thioesterase PaaI-like protein
MEILLKFDDSIGAKANDGRGPLCLRARTQNGCVVCGQENPNGLHIRYMRERDGAITAEWRPTKNWEGFEGIVHGGIISTVLDEAMSKAVAAMNYEALTGELTVRFRHHVAGGRGPACPGMGSGEGQTIDHGRGYAERSRWV